MISVTRKWLLLISVAVLLTQTACRNSAAPRAGGAEPDRPAPEVSAPAPNTEVKSPQSAPEYQPEQQSEDILRAELATHRDIWRSNGFTRYQVTSKQLCFCPREYTSPMRLVVDNGKVIGATYAKPPQQNPTARMGSESSLQPGTKVSADVVKSAKTVDEVFEIIEKNLDAGYARMQVDYDPRFGHPTRVFVDRSLRIADEELHIEFSDLLPMR